MDHTTNRPEGGNYGDVDLNAHQSSPHVVTKPMAADPRQHLTFPPTRSSPETIKVINGCIGLVNNNSAHVHYQLP